MSISSFDGKVLVGVRGCVGGRWWGLKDKERKTGGGWFWDKLGKIGLDGGEKGGWVKARLLVASAPRPRAEIDIDVPSSVKFSGIPT